MYNINIIMFKVPFITKVVSSILALGEMKLIQHYVKKDLSANCGNSAEVKYIYLKLKVLL